ncbi:MAG: endonuclease [Eubacterium sp.]|nr:endonuclease [Eubacterium sp.]
MYMKIPTANMGREEWLRLRKIGIGGSDAGAVCGMNPYSSPAKVFQDKVSDAVSELDSEAVRQGNDLEDYVARRFMEATGLKVRRSNYLYRSAEHPFMVADVDRLVVGEDAGLECKTASAYSAGQWKDGNIPLHYILQCMHYMIVTGRKSWYLAAVVLGKEFICRKLEWDGELAAGLVAAERHFWESYVEKGALPPPDGSKAFDAVLEQYFHAAEKKSAVELVGFDGKLSRREEIMQQISGLEKEQKRIEQEVKLFMQDNELAASGKYRVSWSSVETARLDVKRIREEHPEIYQAYAKVSNSRRFQVRAA